MRIWISGGGTGGHVYPALTVLDAGGPEATDVLWLGRAEGIEATIIRARGLPFQSIAAGPVVGANPARLLGSALRLVRGTWQAWRLMGQRRPDAVLVTGGYVSVPVAVAAWLRRRPLAVYLPDVRPGQAVRLVARLADRVLVTAAASRAALPSRKVVVTGYPVRTEIRAADRAASRTSLGLSPAGPVLLVFGGSQGARHLNTAIVAIAPALLPHAEILHVTGSSHYEAVVSDTGSLPAALADRYHPHAYLDTAAMAAALAAADLVICRAGAAILGELPARGLPAILVPLPIARGHQDDNAAVLVEAGAAIQVPDDRLDLPAFPAAVLDLLSDAGRRQAMGAAARRLDHPGAAAAIWSELTRLAGHRPAATGGGA